MSHSTPDLAPSGAYLVHRSDHWIPADGARCAAWYYAPEGIASPPLVVMAHGLGGTRHMRLDAYARQFAAAGIAALVFDYRGFGDSEGTVRQIVDVRQQLADWRSALAYARAELPVDTARIAIWGTSFGGGHVLSIAAEDHALAGVVAQCPFVDGPSSVWRRFLASPISATVLFVLAIVDVNPRRPAAPPTAPRADGGDVVDAGLPGRARLTPRRGHPARGRIADRRALRPMDRAAPVRAAAAR